MGRKKHSNALKARIALDAIRGQKTMSELSLTWGPLHTFIVTEGYEPKR